MKTTGILAFAAAFAPADAAARALVWGDQRPGTARGRGRAVRKEFQLNNRIVSMAGAVAVACAVILTSGASGQCEPVWVPTFSDPGVNNTVHALTVFDDGSGPALYAGGGLTTAGGAAVNHIAKWDGAAWSALGSGMGGVSSPCVLALAVFDDGAGPALYAGGEFTTAGGAAVNRIAKWDGTAWSALGSGMGGVSSSRVFALTVFDDGSGPALYAGGEFTTAGGATVNRIAKWNGTEWSALGSGMNNWVDDLTVFDDGSGPALYAGGGFATAGGATVNRIAKWDGAAWSALGSGMDKWVSALTVFDDGSGPALYAGGLFTTAGGETVNHIARWDGTAWSALGSGMDNWGSALTVFDDGSGGGPALFAGGDFTTAGGVTVNRIAKWDATAWSALGSGMNDRVSALTVFDDGSGPALYAGGDFTGAGTVSASRIAKWDGAAWSALGSGMGGVSSPWVFALTVFDDGSGPALYAGGYFTTAGGVTVNHIAKWDGTAWSALGSGMNVNGFIDALTVFDDGSGPALYAGGHFTTAGGVTVNGIAKWDGTAWSALGGGMNNWVFALTVFDDGSGTALYAGGSFTTAGGVSANGIAKWDGTAWSALGSGMNVNSWVYALAVFDDGSGAGPALYAGGSFNTAGGVTVKHIAKWDGAAWSALGSGMGTFASVYALSAFDDGSGPALYAGGSFTMAGGVTVNRIAKWDGAAWSALGSGISGTSLPSVDALKVFDDGSGPALYAGGRFNAAGGLPASFIAKWQGCPPCYADCNGSGTLNIDDFLCFQLKFALQDPYADCDGNSVLNIDDFLCFQLAFALGCE